MQIAAASTRERLLQVGLDRAKQAGLRAVTVRGVTADAGANLGSFVHHFGTREAYVAELIEHWYAPLMARTEALLASPAPSTSKRDDDKHKSTDGATGLRSLVLGIADWMLSERGFFAHLVMDAAAGEPGALAFLQSMGDRHPALVLRAIVMAQQRGEMRAEDPVAVLLALLAVVGLPVLLFQGLGARQFLPAQFAQAFENYALQREHVAQRVDWLLRGLAHERPPRHKKRSADV